MLSGYNSFHCMIISKQEMAHIVRESSADRTT